MAYVIEKRRQCDRCNEGLMVLKEYACVSYWQCVQCKHKTYVMPKEIQKIDKDINGIH